MTGSWSSDGHVFSDILELVVEDEKYREKGAIMRECLF